MKNALTDLRDELAATLNDNAGVAAKTTAWATVPEEASTPLIAVAGGRPYLSYDGANYGCVIVRLQVIAAVEQAENEAEDEAVDDIVLAVLAALAGTRFTVEEVEQPGEVIVNGQSCLGVIANVWTETQLAT